MGLQLATSPPVHRLVAVGTRLAKGGLVSLSLLCQDVQGHTKVINLHGCNSETTLDSHFNYYFGKYSCRISTEYPSPFYKFKYIF